MHVPELLHALLRRPYIEAVVTRLPERPALPLVCKQIALTRVPPFALGQSCMRCALLHHLHHGRGTPDFWFPSRAGECVPASRHTRRPRTDSARGFVPES